MARRSILIVDDEVNQRFMLAQALRNPEDRQIATVASVPEALDWLDQHRVDLIITDYNMPVMNGLTLVAQVRERALAARIILITAYSSPDLQEAARRLRVDYFLTKPVPLAQLRSLAAEFCSPDEPDAC